ncbi:hypothetical protein D3C77_636460 [compost metagenome]
MFTQIILADSSSQRRSSSVALATSMPNHRLLAGVRPDCTDEDKVRAESVVVPSRMRALRFNASWASIISL